MLRSGFCNHAGDWPYNERSILSVSYVAEWLLQRNYVQTNPHTLRSFSLLCCGVASATVQDQVVALVVERFQSPMLRSGFCNELPNVVFDMKLSSFSLLCCGVASATPNTMFNEVLLRPFSLLCCGVASATSRSGAAGLARRYSFSLLCCGVASATCSRPS